MRIRAELVGPKQSEQHNGTARQAIGDSFVKEHRPANTVPEGIGASHLGREPKNNFGGKPLLEIRDSIVCP